MSENEQEETSEDVGIPAVPGHQGGAPDPAQNERGKHRRHADSGRSEHVEPRAGLDK